MSKKYVALFLLGAVLSGLSVGSTAHALISDGSNAVDLIGQYDGSILNPTPSYTTADSSFGANEIGLSQPAGMVVDTTNHRLFVSDSSNNRILVHVLTSGDELIDYVPDYVLGQTTFSVGTASSTASGLSNPQGLAYDATGNRLFVAEQGGNRVKVFDVASITNGEAAVNVLGQATFTGATATSTQSGMSAPVGLAYDATGNRLFVSEQTGNRVKIFDVASITDGENAAYVIGQTTFTGASSANTQIGLNSPRSLAFDSVGNRLFVAERTGNRVKIFDVATSSDGEPATYVIGQANFTGSTAANTQSGLREPQGLAFDLATNRLFVAENGGNRVKIFDVATSSDGEPAVNVLGQANFTGAAAEVSQTGASTPYGLAFNPTTNKLFVSDNANRITLFDVATITDGEAAVDLIGQYNSIDDLTPVYTTSSTNMSPNALELGYPENIALDVVGHRLFISDYGNHRVLVHTLDSDNELVDYVADYVLGQTDFKGSSSADTQSGLESPMGLAYDAVNQRLFVAEEIGNRVKVFDVASITNGENAVNILGQAVFTTSDFDTTQSTLNSPWYLAYDATGNRLFVSDRYNDRVMVFDVTSITDGEDAVNVIGQPDFDTWGAFAATSTLDDPAGLAYDATGNRLFVSSTNDRRVMVYDVAEITDGENAVNVIGQLNFTSYNCGATQVGICGPRGLAYDSVDDRLFIADAFYNRVTAYEVSTITNGEAAENVLGQANFVSTSAADTQSGLNSPTGIAFDSSNGRLYVAEDAVYRVKIFDALKTAIVVEEEEEEEEEVAPAPVAAPKGTSSARRASNLASLGAAAAAPVESASPLISTPDLATFIERLRAILGLPSEVTSSSTAAASATFPTSDLSLGSRGAGVKSLQEFLISKNVGSAAKNLVDVGATGYFGEITRLALAEYQASVGISPAQGYFGAKTRAYLGSIGY